MPKGWDEFIYDRSVSALKLTSHHYVSVHENRAFKDYKENVAEGEAAVVGDFNENYNFLILSEVQSYHRDVPQCIAHPLVT